MTVLIAAVVAVLFACGTWLLMQRRLSHPFDRPSGRAGAARGIDFGDENRPFRNVLR